MKTTAIRQSARGEECTVRIPGICTFDTAATIWSHYRGQAGGKGFAIKSIDEAGAYCCTACDAVYDGQRSRPPGMSKDDVDLAWLQGHIRSLVTLKRKGLIG